MGQTQCARSTRDICNALWASDDTLSAIADSFVNTQTAEKEDLEAQLSVIDTAIRSANVSDPEYRKEIKQLFTDRKVVEAKLRVVNTALSNHAKGNTAIEGMKRKEDEAKAAAAQQLLLHRNGVTPVAIERNAREIQTAVDSANNLVRALKSADENAVAAERLDGDRDNTLIDIDASSEADAYISKMQEQESARQISAMDMPRSENVRNHNLKPIPKTRPALVGDEPPQMTTNDSLANDVAQSSADYLLELAAGT